MTVSALSACIVCSMYTPGPCGDQKRMLDELELWMVGSHNVGARKKNLGPLQEQEVMLTTE